VSNVAIRSRVQFLLLVLGPLTSLAISPFSSFDPINLVKLLFVVGISFSLFTLLLVGGFRNLIESHRLLFLFSSGFIVWMFIAALLSSAPLHQQVWGMFGRNTGGLTYLALIIVLIATASVTDKRFYFKIVDALVLTSIPMTVYALIQLAGRDPISWSEMAPFATLGNINFSSAFFGLAALCSITLGLSPSSSWKLRLVLLSLSSTQMLIVLETGSIQGFMIFIAGMGVGVLLWLRSNHKFKVLQIPYIVFGVVGFVAVVAALFNVGPLARFIFQNTILFRFDYWYAGWMMTLKNPVFGVGLDSYGDWYRELRGEVATLRTGPDRITNTAHNIYLDISASGGFPLLFFYLLILGLALRAGIKVIRRQKEFNPYFTALFSAWVAYLIQAGVSINQVGVGIWGWLFTGALIGYEVVSRNEQDKQSSKPNSLKRPSQLPASAALLGILGFGVGLALAFVPFNADAKFKDALGSGVLQEQFSAAKALGATAYHMELALDAAIKANDELLATEITKELLQRYPRDFMGWRVKQVLTSSTPEEREEAYLRLREMDPFNPTIQEVG
jgi:O-antigen ligase